MNNDALLLTDLSVCGSLAPSGGMMSEVYLTVPVPLHIEHIISRPTAPLRARPGAAGLERAAEREPLPLLAEAL